MARSTEERRAFLSTLCKITMDWRNYSPPNGGVVQFREEEEEEEDGADSDVFIKAFCIGEFAEKSLLIPPW